MCVTSSVWALELSPMEMEFSTQGSGTSQVFSVTNKFTKDIGVELKIYKRRTNSKGEEVREDAEDFLIFPRQIKLSPGQRKAVRISWTGPAVVKKEIAYRLVLEQLPIDFKGKDKDLQKIDIDFLLKYVASLYVVPEQAKSEIILEKPVKRDGRIYFSLKNVGTRHLVISKLMMTLDGQDLSFSASSLREILGKNLLSGSSLEFSLPWPKELKTKDLARVKVQVE